MKRVLLIGAAVTALSGCGSAGHGTLGLTPGTPTTLTAAETATVQEGLRKSLKDPESARFGATAAVKRPEGGGLSVCGFVNAKNSYGGYTGEKPYVGTLSAESGQSRFAVIDIGSDESSTASVLSICRNWGAGVRGL
jgi:hypothetical protein